MTKISYVTGMSNVLHFGTESWATGSVGRRGGGSRQRVRCALLHTILLALIESISGGKYIDRECALERKVSNASLLVSDQLYMRLNKTACAFETK